MVYDQHILHILTEAGERGISIKNICRHVYNMNCTLFIQPDFADIVSYVRQYLQRNSKSTQSLIENTGRRGYYRLNTSGSSDARQLLLEFRDKCDKDDTDEENIPSATQDLSLSLFD